jgi:hypothetical protein
MAKYKCQEKYFGYKTSEEYREHCQYRANNASTNGARLFWQHLADKGEWL